MRNLVKTSSIAIAAVLATPGRKTTETGLSGVGAAATTQTPATSHRHCKLQQGLGRRKRAAKSTSSSPGRTVSEDRQPCQQVTMLLTLHLRQPGHQTSRLPV
jgi:hypothetical protein